MNYPIKKLFRGCASVRDYVIHDCITKNITLKIIFNGKIMSLTPKQLLNNKQITKTKIQSQYQGTYYLYDYKFVSDDYDDKQLKFLT